MFIIGKKADNRKGGIKMLTKLLKILGCIILTYYVIAATLGIVMFVIGFAGF